MTRWHPQLTQIGIEAVLEAINNHSDSAARALRWQFRFLLFGAAMFIVWHGAEMYLRLPGAQQSLPAGMRTAPAAAAPANS